MVGVVDHLGTVTKPIPKIKTVSGVRNVFPPEQDMFIGGWTQPTGTGQIGTWPSGATLTVSNDTNATYTFASDALSNS